MKQQARNMAIAWGDAPPTHLIHDRDTKFTSAWKAMVEEAGTERIVTPPRAPSMNAYAERWVLSARTECLDHFVFCGERHVQQVLAEYVHYYNELRPHQSLGNRTIPAAMAAEEPPAQIPFGKVVRRKLLGGLISHYERQVAWVEFEEMRLILTLPVRADRAKALTLARQLNDLDFKNRINDVRHAFGVVKCMRRC